MTEIKPKRVISSREYNDNEYRSGVVPSGDYNAARMFNENPSFDPETKPYKFIAPIKSQTRNHGWHFQMKETGEYFLGLQHRLFGATEYVSIFHTDQKQNFNPAKQKAIIRYPTAVDIETVVDDWIAKGMPTEETK